jgi:murein L,D-transpeptidase YcbB/YkuD
MSTGTRQLESIRKMRLTKNRQLILKLLDEEMEGSMPPHSVSYLHYILKTLVKYKWQGYPQVLSIPDKRNINRTCVDLLNAGYLVVSRVKCEPLGNNLPYWEKEYQLASSVERNFIITECDQLYSAVNTAKHGVNFFGTVLSIGLPDAEVKVLEKRVKVMLQRTHPDKATGHEVQFKSMREAKDIIKSGIPLPDELKGVQPTPQQPVLL